MQIKFEVLFSNYLHVFTTIDYCVESSFKDFKLLYFFEKKEVQVVQSVHREVIKLSSSEITAGLSYIV